jgi:Leucine-rich repeat (LRR) protein
MTAKGVLDLSFNDLAVEADVNTCLINLAKVEEQKNGGVTISPTKTKRRQTETKAIRLGNNNISDVDMLSGPLSQVCVLENVHWLDLSFNGIEKLTESFAKSFPNLSMLYLQANGVSRLSELKKLSYFKNLKSVVLFGNPIEGSKHYRSMILWACPQLQILDFCPITADQRRRNKIWASTFRRKLYPDEDWD